MLRRQFRATRQNPRQGANPRHTATVGQSKYERIVRLPDFHKLSKVEQVIKLIEDHQCAIREAARVTGVNKSSIGHAQKALKENHSIGKAGKPTVLGIEGEHCTIEAIKDADEKRKSLTYAQLRAKVCSTPTK